MEIKKITEGLSATEVSLLLDKNFRNVVGEIKNNSEKIKDTSEVLKKNNYELSKMSEAVSKLDVAVEGLKDETINNKGYFGSSEDLALYYPSANVGNIAYVGSSYPYQIWRWNGSVWVNTGKTGGEESIDLKDYYKKEELDSVSYEEVKMSDLPEETSSLGGGGKWYHEEGKGYHKAIKVDSKKTPKIKISLGTGTSIGFLSSYNPPYQRYDVVPYCPSSPDRITQDANTEVIYDIPSDCAYIVFTTVDGAGIAVDYRSVILINRVALPKKIEGFESDLDRLNYKETKWRTIDLKGIEQESGSLNKDDATWFHEEGKGYHKAVKVERGGVVRVKNPSIDTFIGFLSSYNPPYQKYDVVPYSSLKKGRITVQANDTTQIDIPSDCTYIVFTTVDGAGNGVSYEKIEIYGETDGVLQQFVDETSHELNGINIKLNAGGEKTEIVDLNILQDQLCSLGKNGQWFYEEGKGMHKAVNVGGKKYVKVQTVDNVAYIGFLSSYNPPYQRYDVVPYCPSSPDRITQDANTEVIYDIPSDCAYIVFTTVDGAGIAVDYGNIELYSDISIVEALDELRKKMDYLSNGGNVSMYNNVARVKVLGWNVGHYSKGTGTSSAITNEDYIQKRTDFRMLLNDIAADVVGVVEYSDVFNSSTGESSSDAIFSQYKNKNFGIISVSGYVCNGLLTNIDMPKPNRIDLPNGYYAIESKVVHMGSTFTVCCAHLPWQSDEYNKTAINILIDHYRSTDKVIIIGDFNVRSVESYDLFSDAGYVMANHGYLGDIVTYPEKQEVLDNIIVKGGKIIRTEVKESELSDHYPIIADVVI